MHMNFHSTGLFRLTYKFTIQGYQKVCDDILTVFCINGLAFLTVTHLFIDETTIRTHLSVDQPAL